LIWYNSSTIRSLGYENYKDLIHQNANPLRNYFWPAIFAIAYPFVKWFFNWIQTWVGTKEEKTIKVVSGKGYVPTSKYLRIIEQYDEDVLKLSKILEDEGTLVAENANLKTTLVEKNESIVKASNHLTTLEEKTEVRVFNGDWEITLKDSSFSTVFNKKYHIQDGSGYDYEDRTKSGVIKTSIEIDNYIMNPFNYSFTLVLKLGSDEFVFVNCQWKDDFSHLEGGNKYYTPYIYLTMTKVN